MKKTMMVMVLLVLSGCVMAAEPVVVGRLGAKEVLVFQGNETFTREQICRQLYADTDVIVALSPEAPLADYLSTVKSKLVSGYRNNGFYDPHVSLSFDEEHQTIVVAIEEGPRYREGRIVITGAGGELAQELPRCLQSGDAFVVKSETMSAVPSPAVDPKIIKSLLEGSFQFPFTWNDTEWVCFDKAFIKAAHPYVDKLLNLLGYYQAQFELTVVPSHESRTAELHLAFASPGIKARIGAIEITGNRINSDEKVLAWLGIGAGMPINSVLAVEIEHKLRESGRFRRFSVKPVVNETAPDSSVLTIDLEETPSVTPLGDPLTEKETLMLQVGKWLSEYDYWQEDLHLTLATEWPLPIRLEGVLAPQRGLILTDTAGDGTTILAFQKDRMQLVCPQWDQYVLASGPEGEVEISLAAIPEPQRSDWNVNVRMGMTGDPRRSGEGPGCKIQMNVPPAFWLYSANNKDMQVTRLDPERILIKHQEEGGKSFEATLNPITGKIIEIKSDAFLLECRPGAFEEQLGDMQARIDAASLTPIRTQSSFAVLCHMLMPLYLSHSTRPVLAPDQKRAVLKAWNRILSEDIASCIPTRSGHEQPEPENCFSLPPYDLLNSGDTMMRMVMGGVFGWCHDNLPQDHWLRLVAHIAVLTTAGQGQSESVTREIRTLYASGQIGPVGYFLIAKAFQMLGHPAYRFFIERSWQTLSPGGFRTDWEPLLAGDSPLSRNINCALGRLQTRAPEDIRLVASVLPEQAAPRLEAAFQWLRDHRDQTFQQLLDPWLTELWNDQIETEMQGILAGMDAPLAIKYLGIALQRDPNNPTVYYRRGTSYTAIGDPDNALDDYSRAIELDPNFAVAYVDRSDCHVKREEYDQAIADCTVAIGLNPGIAQAYCNRGVALAMEEEYDRAIADYGRAIELDAGNAIFHYNRANAYLKKRSFQEAIADCNLAIEMKPDEGVYYILRGGCRYESKEYRMALDDLLKARELQCPVADSLIKELREKTGMENKDASTR